MNGQLPLDFPAQERLGAEDFILSDANREAHAFVAAWPEWGAPGLILHGPEASGKTHLAHIWAQKAGARLIAPAELRTQNAPLMRDARPMVIEQVERVRDEEALFHLYNTLKSQGSALLLTSRLPPGEWPFTLPDLTSRLRALPALRLDAPDDALLGAVLEKHFSDRQLTLPPEVVAFLLPRMERSLASAKEMAAALDRAAMAQKRPVSVALARQVLASFKTL